MKSEIQAAVTNLAEADDDSLFARLGAYSAAFPVEPGNFVAPGAVVAVDAALAGPLDQAKLLGRRILSRWNRTLYDLVCGEGGDPQAAALIKAATSRETLAAAIASVLIGMFSVAPAIAAIVGVLLGRVLLPAAGAAICDFWKDHL